MIRHLAIIMDGNGRWAKARGLPRSEGHRAGGETVRRVLGYCRDAGIQYLTLYAFSVENWSRPKEEVDALMGLFCQCVTEQTPELIEERVRVRLIGRRDRFSEQVNAHLERIERETAGGDRLTLILAFDYSSREEIARAARVLAERAAAGEIRPEDISEKAVSDSLYTAGIPDPDFIIRTSGECRLSNFLLWQASYAEMYFPQVLWPDFGQEEFDKALEEYAGRERRYGRL